jgi:hypothetical protein
LLLLFLLAVGVVDEFLTFKADTGDLWKRETRPKYSLECLDQSKQCTKQHIEATYSGPSSFVFAWVDGWLVDMMPLRPLRLRYSFKRFRAFTSSLFSFSFRLSLFFLLLTF